MKSGIAAATATLLLFAACGPTTPPPRGVGFNNYEAYQQERARREAALSAPRTAVVPPPQVNTVVTPATPTPIPAPTPEGEIPSSDLAAAGIGTGVVTTPQAGTGTSPVSTPQAPVITPTTTGPTTTAQNGRTGGVEASPNNAPPPLAGNPSGISDEQNFDAVSGRETIESDAQRRAAQAAARQEVQPTAVPQRPQSTGPNIVEYAINAPNVKGQEWYSRSLLSSESRFQRNCAAYGSPDEAQRDFLLRGGPERDRLGIDPDGDGFACGWDPAPYKRAAGN